MTIQQTLKQIYEAGKASKTPKHLVRLRVDGYDYELVVTDRFVNMTPKGKKQWRSVAPYAVDLIVDSVMEPYRP